MLETWSSYFGALLIVIALVGLLRPAETFKWNVIGAFLVWIVMIVVIVLQGKAAWPVGW